MSNVRVLTWPNGSSVLYQETFERAVGDLRRSTVSCVRVRCKDGSEFVGEIVNGIVNWELALQRMRLDAVAAALFPELPRSTYAHIRAHADAPTSMFIELRTHEGRRYALEFDYLQLLDKSNDELIADAREKARLLRLTAR